MVATTIIREMSQTAVGWKKRRYKSQFVLYIRNRIHFTMSICVKTQRRWADGLVPAVAVTVVTKGYILRPVVCYWAGITQLRATAFPVMHSWSPLHSFCHVYLGSSLLVLTVPSTVKVQQNMLMLSRMSKIVGSSLARPKNWVYL